MSVQHFCVFDSGHPKDNLVRVGRQYMCPDCFKRLYTTCPDCGKVHLRSEVITVLTSRGAVELCSACARHYRVCKICGFQEKTSEMVHIEGGSDMICKEHTDFYGISSLSGRAYLRGAMEKIRLADGSEGLVCPEEADFHSVTTTRASSVSTGTLISLRSTVDTRSVGRCSHCGELFEVPVHGDVTIYYTSRRTQQLLCPSCAAKAVRLDCGHVNFGEPTMLIPITTGMSDRDCDGCMPALESSDREASAEPIPSSGQRVCTECGERWRRMQFGGKHYRYVLNYSYTPEPLVMHRQSPEDAGPLMGFELEVDEGRDATATARQVLQEVGRKHLYIKSDGSLHGESFEQVTHPATIDYYLAQRERYEKLLTIPKAHGFKSHDTGHCGLHVHVDRAFVGHDTDEGVRKVIFVAEKFFPEIFLFSRRDSESQQTWAARWLEPLDAALMTAQDLDTMFASKLGDGNRRKMVNIQRSPTLEFRIFRGTLNKTTFWATLELVNNLVCIAKNTPREKLDDLTWHDVIHFREFPELLDYNARRVGDSWSGALEVEIPESLDNSDQGVVEKVHIPSVLGKNSLKHVTCVAFLADNAVLRAAWPRISAVVEQPGMLHLDITLHGKSIELSEDTSATPKIAYEKGILVRKDIEDADPLKWVLIDARLFDLLPPGEAVETLRSAVYKTYDCIKINEAARS